jgi:hypothetical protein
MAAEDERDTGSEDFSDAPSGQSDQVTIYADDTGDPKKLMRPLDMEGLPESDDEDPWPMYDRA